ncbi:hypothetical protein CEXT_798541 [Caerostris extrusa]|uniref:Uncharacterized protein n=1 Tax=Caerostris extrusa TaxID=172846 RepID=A0AAV4Q4J6_CAEEX|nr:hypothetical protein CEXT_798541 [Caerostris extrusa]
MFSLSHDENVASFICVNNAKGCSCLDQRSKLEKYPKDFCKNAMNRGVCALWIETYWTDSAADDRGYSQRRSGSSRIGFI